MKRKSSFRKEFNALAAGLLLTATAPTAAGQAQTTPLPPQPQPIITTAIKAAPMAYRPFSPTGEICPVTDVFAIPKSWPTPSFDVSAREQERLIQTLGMNIGRNAPDGIFTERMTASVNEFRHLYYGNVSFHESLTATELSDLREFSARVLREQKANGLTLDAAVALRFAAHATGVDYATLLSATEKGHKKFEPEAAAWLHLVKTYGSRYGLGFFVDHIYEAPAATGQGITVSVSDPVVLQLLMAMQDYPRLSRMMQAEAIKNAGALAPATYQSPLGAIPDLYKKQQDLATLGMMPAASIDGQATPLSDIAVMKFKALYGPLLPANADPLTQLGHFAQLARTDASEHSISTPAAAAIRLANLRTGANFGYMMELSSAESQFDVDVQASTSSARGLYQFTEDTWIQTVNRYGDKYAMQQLATQFESKDDMNGTLVGRSENPFVRVLSMELRNDPHLAALMSGEFQIRNKFLIECNVGHNLNRTEQYFGHFLGARGAAQFIVRMNQKPAASAPDMFTTAADANKSVFFKRDRHGRRLDRSLSEVYEVFSRKFDRDSYEDTASATQLINAFVPATARIQWPAYATVVAIRTQAPVPVYVAPVRKKAPVKAKRSTKPAPKHTAKRRHK